MHDSSFYNVPEENFERASLVIKGKSYGAAEREREGTGMGTFSGEEKGVVAASHAM